MDNEKSIEEQLMINFEQVKQSALKYLIEQNFIKDEKEVNIKNVIRYNKDVELTKKDSEGKEKHGFKLYVVEWENTNPDLKDKNPLGELEFLVEEDENGNIVNINTIADLIQEYEGFENIKDVVDKTKENEEKPEEEQDKELRKDSLEELEKEKEKEEKEEKEETTGKKDKSNEVLKNKKISNIKGEVDLDQQVNGETLRKILDLGEDDESIAPVRASSVGVVSSSEYVFVAIKSDKTCTVLGEDKIVEDRQKGTNPDEKDLMINNDGTVSEESSLANFRIANRPNFVLSVRHDESSSTRETTISDVSGRESRDEDVAQELHKDGDERIDDDARILLQMEEGISGSDEISENQEQHEEAGCKNDRVENIDEDKTNDTHIHLIITRDTELPGREGMTVEQWAEELGENPDVIVDRLQREVDKDDGRKPSQIIEEIESDYERAGRNHNF